MTTQFFHSQQFAEVGWYFSLTVEETEAQGPWFTQVTWFKRPSPVLILNRAILTLAPFAVSRRHACGNAG